MLAGLLKVDLNFLALFVHQLRVKFIFEALPDFSFFENVVDYVALRQEYFQICERFCTFPQFLLICYFVGLLMDRSLVPDELRSIATVPFARGSLRVLQHLVVQLLLDGLFVLSFRRVLSLRCNDGFHNEAALFDMFAIFRC